jgi:type VI secretion system protein ImpL
MKLITPKVYRLFNLYQKHIITGMILTVISVFIGCYGSLILVANTALLQGAEKKAYVIVLLYLGWVLKIIFYDMHPKNKPEPILFGLPETKKKLQHLQGCLQGAIEFLKKTVIHKQGKNINLAKLPWYWVIGPPGTGKTTLLANSGINYILAKQFKGENLTEVPPSDFCNWWVTRDLVLVDVPGSYLIAKPKDTAQPEAVFHYLWRHLLYLIKTNCHKNKAQGIVVMLHLPELIKEQSNPQTNEIIFGLRKRIIDLLVVLGQSVPIHLVLTKCDLLPGFTEFFSEYNAEEAAQAWGVTIPLLNQDEKLSDVFVQRFNALIKRLNKQLVLRLHQERGDYARSYIKDFPLHLERLKESISHFIKALNLPKLPLCGVYLTSGKQVAAATAAGYFPAANLHYSSQSLPIISVPAIPRRAYFIRQLILHNLPVTSVLTAAAIKKPPVLQRRVVYITAAGMVVAAAIFLGQDFSYGVRQAYSVHKGLAQYQVSMQQAKQPSDYLIQSLPLLNSLRQAANAETGEPLLTFYANRSKKAASLFYHQALQSRVIPEIKNYFEKYLKTANSKNPEQVYSVLKAYLMLHDQHYFQANFMLGMLQQLMPDQDKAAVAALTQHLYTAVMSASIPAKLDNGLVMQVRKQLINLPTATLGFVILKNMENNNVDHIISLGTALGNPPVFTSQAVAMQIPSMFTAKKFHEIVTTEVNVAAAESLRGNRVLGSNPVLPNQSTIDALAAQLQTQYITNYVDIWESLLANIKLNVPQNLAQVDAMAAVITGHPSPLLQLLDTVKQNTALVPIVAGSPKLQNLSVLLVDANRHQTSTLYEIFASLQALHTYLQAMLSAPDTGKAIFQAVAQRMQRSVDDPIARIHAMAEQSPEPMKTWLETIAEKSWYFLLQEASKYIEIAWQKDRTNYFVAPPSKGASMPPAVFLSQQAALANFYKNFLQPFVNDKQKKWQWQRLEGQKIPFSDSALQQLVYALHLQTLPLSLSQLPLPEQLG